MAETLPYELHSFDPQSEINSINLRPLTPDLIDGYADEALADLINIIGRIEGIYDRQPTIAQSAGTPREQAALAYFGLSADIVQQTLQQVSDRTKDRESQSQSAEVNNYLTHDGLTKPAIARQLGLNRHTVYRAIEELGDALGETKVSQHGQGRPYAIYSLGQVAIIGEHLAEEGYLGDPLPDHSTVGTIAEEFAIAPMAVQEAIDALGDALGEVAKTRRGGGNRKVYSPVQKQQIGQWLRDTGRLTDIAPKDYAAAKPLARALGVSVQLVTKMSRQLGDLGQPTRLRHPGNLHRMYMYSPEQQARMKEYLERANKIFDEIPDDYVPIATLAKRLHIAVRKAQAVIDELDEDLGLILVGKGRNGKPIKYYSPAQQDQIEERLRQKGGLVNERPAPRA